VRRLFAKSAGTRFVLSRVEFIENELSLWVSSHMKVLHNRRQDQEVFNPDNPSNSEKAALLSLLKSNFETADSKANVLLFWHGPSAEAPARSIARHGFAALSVLDPGYYGCGRYGSLEAEYACKYASEYPEPKVPNGSGEWPLLLVAGVVSMAYPITACADDFRPPLPVVAPEQCNYFGQPMKPKYDTHVVPVREPEFLVAPVDGATFHELVFDQDAQLLPLALVWFKKP